MSIEEKIKTALEIANKLLKSDKWKIVKNHKDFGYDTWWIMFDKCSIGYLSNRQSNITKESMESNIRTSTIYFLINSEMFRPICKLDKKKIK